MLKYYFRCYDIRGIVDDCFNEEFAFLLGLSFGNFLKSHNFAMTVLVGRDGRESSPLFAHKLIQGLRISGVEVINSGCIATPVTYFGCYTKNTANAIMITGSHNPVGYNGFKMIVDSRSITEDEIIELKHLVMDYKDKKTKPAENPDLKPIIQYPLDDKYVDYISKQITLKKPYKIVVDAGNGMGALVAPKLYKALGCEVIELYCTIDGTFPNHHPDPSKSKNMEELKNAVIKHEADLGIAFDGDADRIGIITNKGNNIAADCILAILAGDILEQDKYKGAPVIFDVKCSQVVADYIRRKGGQPIIWKTGHSLIKQKMAEHNAPIAGELSGHIFFYDRWFGVDDAVYAGARLLEILDKDKYPDIDSIFAELPNMYSSPELNIEVTEETKQEIITKLCKECQWDTAVEVIDIDGIRVEFENGWGLVRASNTTPMLVLRFEGKTQADLSLIINNFCTEVKRVCPQLDCSDVLSAVK